MELRKAKLKTEDRYFIVNNAFMALHGHGRFERQRTLH